MSNPYGRGLYWIVASHANVLCTPFSFYILWLLEAIGSEYKLTHVPAFSERKTQTWIHLLWKFHFHSWKEQVGLINRFEIFIFIPEILS